VPNRKIPIVIYDHGGKRAKLAAESLAELGYSDVAVVEGGLASWQQARLPTVSGVNVPGGDIVLWVNELRQRWEKPIIVNCAGRTRSIIGTAALRRLGVDHARALKNGTMGWVLAGFELESHPERQTIAASEDSRHKATALALQLAAEEGIRWITAPELSTLKKHPDNGVTYIVDVRSETEYDSGHLPASLNIPGGQAVQRADDFVAVRNAKIVFVSDTSARAVMAAYWFQQMGFPNVMVLQGGLRAWIESGEPLAQADGRAEPLGYVAAAKLTTFVDTDELERKVKNSQLLILDVGTSLDFETAHVPGAYWISRGWIELRLPERFPDRSQAIVLTCPDSRHSVFAAQALRRIGYTGVAVLRGGVRAWASAGHGTEAGLDRCLVEANDVVLSPSIQGNKEEMQRYLDWEVNLKSNDGILE
jgi:rhodanese-related sulfurtransferase